MTTTLDLRRPNLRPRSGLLLPLVALAASACTDPNVFLPSYQPGGPQGIMTGTVTYSGPLPCTEGGHVVGAAVFLAFDTRLLPPPEGLGTSAASVAAIGGDQLFGGVVDSLTFNKDGSRWCPSGPTAITVSGDWTVGALPGGEYEVRSFYDLHGQFDPAFSISKLPHQGDIAGGAIDNVSDVLKSGAAPQYRRITLGVKKADGTYEIPPQGSNIGGIAVTLGLTLPTGLPIFYPAQVMSSSATCQGTMPVGMGATSSTDLTKLVLPQDYRLPVFNPTDPGGTETSILRVKLTAGVAADEVKAAAASPFNLPVQGPPDPTFSFSWQDVNGDGMFDITHDHTAASGLVPSLFPLSIFSKLVTPVDAKPGSPDDLVAQSSPVVVLQGLTIYKSLLSTVGLGLGAGVFDITPDTDVYVGITPAVICLDPNDHSSGAKAKLVLSHETACGDKDPLLQDPKGTLDALSKQFGRPVELVEACLPQGRYAMNLVYSTGQAWSVPNEAGVCATSEPLSPDGKTCVGTTPMGPTPRAHLASQDLVLTIGPSQVKDYCKTHAVPAECCPPLKDPKAARVDGNGQCVCPDPKNAACQ